MIDRWAKVVMEMRITRETDFKCLINWECICYEILRSFALWEFSSLLLNCADKISLLQNSSFEACGGVLWEVKMLSYYLSLFCFVLMPNFCYLFCAVLHRIQRAFADCLQLIVKLLMDKVLVLFVVRYNLYLHNYSILSSLPPPSPNLNPTLVTLCIWWSEL